ETIGSHEDATEAVVGISILRVELKGSASNDQGLVILTTSHVEKTDVVKWSGVPRIGFDPLLVGGDSLEGFSRDLIVVMTFDVEAFDVGGAVLEFECFAQAVQGRRVLQVVAVDDAEDSVSRGEVGIEFGGFFQMGSGFDIIEPHVSRLADAEFL